MNLAILPFSSWYDISNHTHHFFRVFGSWRTSVRILFQMRKMANGLKKKTGRGQRYVRRKRESVYVTRHKILVKTGLSEKESQK